MGGDGWNNIQVHLLVDVEKLGRCRASFWLRIHIGNHAATIDSFEETADRPRIATIQSVMVSIGIGVAFYRNEIQKAKAQTTR